MAKDWALETVFMVNREPNLCAAIRGKNFEQGIVELDTTLCRCLKYKVNTTISDQE